MEQIKAQHMIKSILAGMLILLAATVSAQVQTHVIGDSVHLRSNTGTAELILENSTKDVNGFLYNKGNGRTEFRNGLIKVNDSIYVIGADTLNLAVGGAVNSAVQSLTDGSTISWDVTNGINGSVTLSGTDRTLSISNPVAGQVYRVKIVQDGTGSRTIGTWPAGTLWPSGTMPVLSTAPSSIDLVTLYYDGTNYYGDSKLLYKPVSSGVVLHAYDAKEGLSATVHSLTSVPAGALLVLTTSAGTSQFNANITSSPSLTWTKRVDATTAYSGDAEIYTAVFTAGGNITITSDWNNQPQASVSYVIVNQESSLGGATASGVSQSEPSVSITTTRANSIIIAVTSDWNAISSSKTYRNSPTETKYSYVSGGGTFYHYYKEAPTATSYTMGLSAPTGQSSGTALIEIRGN